MNIVDISQLEPNPWNPVTITREKRRKLRKSIKETNGAHLRHNPVKVREIDDHYQIIDGEKRWRISKELGFEEIPIEVLDVSEEKAKELTITINKNRGTIDYYKLSKLLNEEKDEDTTQAELGKRFGFGQGRISHILRIYPRLKSYASAHNDGLFESKLSNAQMEELSRIKRDRFREVVTNMAVEKSSSEIRELASNLNDLEEIIEDYSNEEEIVEKFIEDRGEDFFTLTDYQLTSYLRDCIEKLTENFTKENVCSFLNNLLENRDRYDFYGAIDEVRNHFHVEENEAGRIMGEIVEENEDLNLFIGRL